jgi:hypothetical protein
MVVPGKITVIDVEVVHLPCFEQLRETGEIVAAFRGLHQILEGGQVRKTGEGGECALVGMRAVGEKTGE